MLDAQTLFAKKTAETWISKISVIKNQPQQVQQMDNFSHNTFFTSPPRRTWNVSFNETPLWIILLQQADQSWSGRIGTRKQSTDETLWSSLVGFYHGARAARPMAHLVFSTSNSITDSFFIPRIGAMSQIQGFKLHHILGISTEGKVQLKWSILYDLSWIYIAFCFSLEPVSRSWRKDVWWFIGSKIGFIPYSIASNPIVNLVDGNGLCCFF